MIDASYNKRFDFTKAEDVYALQNCDANSNYCDFFCNCEYHESQSLSNVVKRNKDGLFIIHFNERSLQKNIDKLTTILANLFETPDIIAMSETRITYGRLSVKDFFMFKNECAYGAPFGKILFILLHLFFELIYDEI